jgi:[ribosomal protein S18]-alanine N-acetyltransferase
MSPEAMATLHARCFTDAPRPWTAPEFAALLAEPTSLLCTAPGGFALGRLAADEAELLTLAVDPGSRRRGIGRRLVAALEAAARARGAEAVFLEVAEGNAAARALYAACRYAEVGRRPGYYPGAVPSAALVLVKRL